MLGKHYILENGELLIFTYYTVYTSNIDPRITKNIAIDPLITAAK